jgi:predicted MFS family arabinose efflux permease
MAAVLSATSLIGRESPDEGRGAVMGMFSMCGALGIGATGVIGGQLFDHWSPVGPFLLVAGANVILLAAAVVLLQAERRSRRAVTASSTP